MRSAIFSLCLALLWAVSAVAPAAAEGEEETSLSGPLVGYDAPPWLEEPQRTLRADGPSFEDLVMELVNQERWANGQLPPLKRVSQLDSSSETHSSNMASRNFFAHCDLDTGTLPWDRMTAAGYSWNSAGENIAAGYSTPQAVVDGWMGSPGHRANILSTSFRELGIGYVLQAGDVANVRQDQNGDCTADGTYPYALYRYWTQNFGRRNSVYPVVINREAYQTASRNVSLYLYGFGFAVSMRLRNENGAWTPWQGFATNVAWQLSAGGGTKTVHVEISSGAGGTGSVRSASDTIVLAVPADSIFTDGFESGDLSAWN